MKVIVRNVGLRRWKAENDPQLRESHGRGLTDLEIASEMGFAEGTVRTRRLALGLAANARPMKPRGQHHTAKEPPLPVFKVDPLKLAEDTLGTADFDKKLMRLRGSAIKLTPLMRETNARLKAQGKPQCLHNPDWAAK
ncbi:hypothetical protein [Limnoglobus roseus]|uniref:Uncharacterized protein n=1 Tax=Limnoglobus roseus TaxID=2598579 RepID=A0A5C1AKQ8_9BACT|nr:hypothetical protein [Limnoglobus roseus]QEL18747.1 hypothetical protein PX52LOC_05784 [Limnoglobus roseus]